MAALRSTRRCRAVWSIVFGRITPVSPRLADDGGSRCLIVALLCLALAAVACGPRTAAPAAPMAPKFPDYVFPEAPMNTGSPAAQQHQQTGWEYLQAGDSRSADREFNAALKQSPEFYPAEAALGYSALSRRDASSAIEHFDRALSRNPQYAPALAGKGDALLSQNHPDQALRAFEAALAAEPNLQGLRSRAEVLKLRTSQQDIATARKASDENRFDDARRAYAEAIAASPDSAFLYRELAAVDRKAGDTAAALAHAEQAVKLDPSDARSLRLEAQIYEQQRAWAKAAEAYAAANAIEPSDATAAKIDEMQEHAAFESMPVEYKTIAESPAITRAQLAALLGVRLEGLLHRSRATSAPVITDTRGNWAAPWILSVTRAGVMEVFSNHTFQPNAVVRRGDLAHAVSQLLSRIAAEKPRLAAKWRDPRPRFPDVSPAHLSYPAVARAIASGVMDTLEGGTFQLNRPVSGAEAMQVVDRLEALAATK
jgi:tetratricopeptide (TPR) repeat protein